jgi:hypothetical protein
VTDYQYDRFTSSAYDLDRFTGPGPGDPAPDGVLTTPEGLRVNLLDFDGDFLVLELGSITCPLFQSRRGGMADLARRMPGTEFAILYVREAHPGDDVPQPVTAEGKAANARRLADEDGEGRRILIDDLDGTLHKAFGGYPNSIFIVNRSGCVVWRSDWNNPAATARALGRLKSGRSAGRQGAFLPARPPVAIHTLRRAGGGALKDFLRDLPVLVWKNAIRRNLRVLLGRDKPVAPDAVC